MPALADGLGVKIVTFYPPNADRGIPTHMATIFLVDPETGRAARRDGRKINHGDADGCCFGGRDETSCAG